MTIKLDGEDIILEGICRVDEAEALLSALSDHPTRGVVLAAERIHTALWQVLAACAPRVSGEAPDAFSQQFLVPFVALGRGAPKADDEGRDP